MVEIYTQVERALIREFATIRLAGSGAVDESGSKILMEKLEIDFESFKTAVIGLKLAGFFSALSMHRGWSYFTLTSKCIQVAREIEREDAEAAKPRDIVEYVHKKARSGSLAWIIIVFGLLMMVATFINQTVSLLQTLGWIQAKPSQPIEVRYTDPKPKAPEPTN